MDLFCLEEDHFNVNLRFLVNIVTRDFFEWKPLSKDCETNLEHELTFEMQSDIGLQDKFKLRILIRPKEYDQFRSS